MRRGRRATTVAALGAALVLAIAGSARGQEHSGLRMSDRGRPTLDLPIGEIQFRGRVFGTVQSPGDDRASTVPDAGWQSARLQVEGTLFKRLEFEVSREFGDSDEPERDTFANYRFTRAFEVRGGQFKLPFGRDALTGGANLDFVYRSLVGRILAPGRDLGVMAHGRVAARRVTYQAGYFLHDGDNARTEQTRGGENAIAGRVVFAPLAGHTTPLAGFEVGAAVVSSSLDDSLGLRGRTVFGEGVFFDRVFVNGRRLRRGLEAAWTGGPVSVSWEQMRVSDQRTGMGFGGADFPAVTASGWYVAGAWVLTGEHKDGRVEPSQSLFRGGLGAVELTGRVERLTFAPGTGDDAALPPVFGAIPAANTERVVTVGLSWYLTRQLKIAGNAVFESVLDPQRSPAPQDGRFVTGVVQFQFVL